MKTDGVALSRIKDLLWVLVISAAVVGLGRFIYGLGASTNMTDFLPWGVWKVFNMVSGAALATSGFVVAAIIYILQLDKYKSIAKMSVLIGFLGYGSSLTALLFDIGLPHRGWHPFVMWNPHSFLFEVFWCVSIYWTITALELIPILSERLSFPKFTHFMHEIMLPFVVLGVTLSTMHHSSLGSLFMASPTRLHPLWHSMWIPPEFFVSAMGSGLTTIILFLFLFSWLYGIVNKPSVIDRLALLAGIFLALFLVIRIIDFSVHNKWSYLIGSDITWESYLFWCEITLQAVIPVIIFMIAPLRRTKTGLLIGSGAAFIGLILNRMDTGIVGYFRSAESIYIPNVSEIILSLGVMSGAMLIMFLLVERFNIFDPPHTVENHDHGSSSQNPITFSELREVFAGHRAKRVIMMSLLVMPLTWIGLTSEATGPFQPTLQPIEGSIVATDPMRTSFRIDGNMNGKFVDFPHKDHQEFLGDEESCIKCHHLNWPEDNNSNCRFCHRDMLLPTSIYTPKKHLVRAENSDKDFALYDPETSTSEQDTYDTCDGCHKDNMIGLSSYASSGFNPNASGFQHAMHGSCLTCHRMEGSDPTDAEDLGNCLFCHKLDAD